MAVNKPSYDKGAVDRYIKSRIQAAEMAMIEVLKFVGEQYITDSRIGGNGGKKYDDQTGNLRSSVGYVILKNGKQLLSSFPGDIAEGKAVGKRIAGEVAASFPTGLVLIVVAGMSYAAAVESKGFDVISGGASTAEKELKVKLVDLTKKLSAS